MSALGSVLSKPIAKIPGIATPAKNPQAPPNAKNEVTFAFSVSLNQEIITMLSPLYMIGPDIVKRVLNMNKAKKFESSVKARSLNQAVIICMIAAVRNTFTDFIYLNMQDTTKLTGA